jgi:predicted nuclease of predicted toxin-antitoxin system
MRFLADENFPRTAFDALAASGIDILRLSPDQHGSKDTEVLEAARADRRILLTFDKDFGELVFR